MGIARAPSGRAAKGASRMTVVLVTLLLVGALGVYLALPGGRVQPIKALQVVLTLVGAVLAAWLLRNVGGNLEQPLSLTILALIGLWGGVRVITHPKPVYSALFFIVVVISVAGLLVLMQAEFLAASLVIIYAGAILVTYVFVIMLAQQSGGPASYDRNSREPLLGVIAGFAVLAVLTNKMLGGALAGGSSGAATVAAPGTVAEIGTHLLTQYVVGVQIAGVLLLAAMVGAIAIARRKALPDDAMEGEEC